MPDRSEAELFQAIQDGDDRAFDRVYDRYSERARLMAWRISHRADWVDDLLNEAWCRAFRNRKTYNPGRPFAVWFAGILRNVYREQCRKSPTSFDGDADEIAGVRQEGQGPVQIAAEAELLTEINDCVERLEPLDAQIVRLRFFKELTLRQIAAKLQIPESTIRETRLPAAFRALRRCLDKKGIRFSELFPAQG